MNIFNGYCRDEKVYPTNPLQNIFPHFTHVAERVCTPQWHLVPTKHPPHNFIFIYDGEAVFGDGNINYHVSKGDLIYFKASEFRWGYTFPERLMKCYTVDFFYTCPMLKEGKWQMVDYKLPFDTLQKIKDNYVYNNLLDLFKKLTNAWVAGQPNQIMECRAIFIELISSLLLWKTSDGLNFAQMKKVNSVIDYMMEHYAEALSLNELSFKARISPSYLGSIFKKVTGRSPVDYLIEIRINKAKAMLCDGHSISEVAFKTGFNDVFYFSKCFKKREGVSPSGYINNFYKDN
jgi:AraC-like DNA-binding protein